MVSVVIMEKSRIYLIVLLIAVAWSLGETASRNFTIDWDQQTFLKDGQPFHYVSGSIHYVRVPHYYWEDRLNKIYAMGLDTVQTYVAWNVHEPEPGVYNFEGQYDLPRFIALAQKIGLNVVLRSGPYMCAEWEFGGFPAWIKGNNNSIVLRSMDPGYIKPVDRWLSVLFLKIKPYLYSNGGPIIMVQIENEYGSYAGVICDHEYMAHLRDTAHHYLGKEVVLFTTDGNTASYLKCGVIDGAFATVDFGAGGNVSANFDAQRVVNKNKGPLVNSEFYDGWIDHWGDAHSTLATATFTDSLQQALTLKANMNIYMVHGGTTFGYMNGADPLYTIIPTEYDFDAALNEAGDTTHKYWAIRQTISKFKTLPKVEVPRNTSKYAYGDVKMSMLSTVVDELAMLSTKGGIQSQFPLNMEQLHHWYGFTLYRHVIAADYPTAVLNVSAVRDRGYVLLDGVPRGMVDRNGVTQMMLLAQRGQTLDILVENQGRVNYGSQINDNYKGLIANVTLNSQILTGWVQYPLNFTKVFDKAGDTTLKFRSPAAPLPLQPSIFTGHFQLPPTPAAPQDTFFYMCGWFKGQVFINGFNVGRYWPTMGPQVTLFVPAGVLRAAPAVNTLVMVELERAPCGAGQHCTVSFHADPIISAKCYTRGKHITMETSSPDPTVTMHRRRG